MKTRLVIVNIERNSELLSSPERFSSRGRILRCSRMKSEGKRRQAFAAELALSYALSGETLLPPAYGYDANGRPFAEGCFISISHTNGHAACAWSEAPVGVDIEEPRHVSPRLASRILSPEERAAGLAAREGALLCAFVAKEAYLKLTGEGLFGGMDRLTAADGRILKNGETAAYLYNADCEGCICRLASSETTSPEIIVL